MPYGNVGKITNYFSDRIEAYCADPENLLKALYRLKGEALEKGESVKVSRPHGQPMEIIKKPQDKQKEPPPGKYDNEKLILTSSNTFAGYISKVLR